MICLSFRYFHLTEIYIQIWNKNDKLFADTLHGLFFKHRRLPFFFPYKQWNVQQVAASNTEHLLCYIDSVEKYQHQPQTMVSRVSH